MAGENYFMAISGRVLLKPQNKYFMGYFIDKCTEKHRYDMVVSEKSSMQTEAEVSMPTVRKYKILTFAKKEHIKEFQSDSVEAFNAQSSKTSTKYYNFKRIMLGLFADKIEERGLDISNIDIHNINYITGIVKK